MADAKHITIIVDADKELGKLTHDWRYFGYDECNYTHTPEGERLISKFGKLNDGPYYVRAHHMLCTGNAHGSYKWGSTNVYSEDPDGHPVHDWSVIDRIIDTYLRNSVKPFFEIGFMPMELADPRFAPTESGFTDFKTYKELGWACPPKDYDKWFELVKSLARHFVERYGREEPLSWYWELWNEPDIFYWKGTVEEYCRLYDYTEAALHAILPQARLGGPATCGPTPGSDGHLFLSQFLDHCANGTNTTSGTRGTRLDYVTFHAKGGSFPFRLHAPKATPSVSRLVDQVKLGLETIRDHGFGDREVVLSEADPDGWAAGGRFDNANMNFRNTEYYASYVASSYQQIRDLASAMKMDVRPLAWAFMFVGERCFEGTRTFSTRGIDKAIFNLFKIYSLLGEVRCSFEGSQSSRSSGTLDAPGMPDHDSLLPQTGETDVSGFATRNRTGEEIQVMIYAHHDDWAFDSTHVIDLEIRGLPKARRLQVRHFRIDAKHSNAYAEWVRQGRPDYPTGEVWKRIHNRSALEELERFEVQTNAEGSLELSFEMPAHAVSLLQIG